jgi:3-phosphoshikimate 1-carboxyvinyltransferase
MDYIINPVSSVSGEITPPPDKSITHRAVIFAALAEGTSVVENYLAGEDCLRTVRAFEMMGVKIKRLPGILEITGAGLGGLRAPGEAIDAGNSGTTARMLAGILAGQGFTSQITGDSSLSKRPMRRVIEPLALMGAKITAREGNFLPMTVEGNPGLKPINYKSPVASAQVKSCVLLAGLNTKGETVFTESVKSRDHTERMMKAFGADVKVTGLSVSVTGPAKLKAKNLTVPGDISSAAFFLVAGCLASKEGITLKNVGINPSRDGILEVLEKMGASIEIGNLREVSGEPVADITVKKSNLRAVQITREMIPRLIDEIPVIALAATQAQGQTVISGAAELRVKESDRIKTVLAALTKMGAKVTEKADGMVIEGPVQLKGAVIDSCGDHRLVMMAAVAGIIAGGGVKIRNTDCVNTSYPGFLQDMKKIGADCGAK